MNAALRSVAETTNRPQSQSRFDWSTSGWTINRVQSQHVSATRDRKQIESETRKVDVKTPATEAFYRNRLSGVVVNRRLMCSHAGRL